VVSLKLQMLYLVEKAPITHWTGVCTGPSVGLDVLKKFLSPAGIRKLDRRPRSPVVIPTTTGRQKQPAAIYRIMKSG